MYLNDALNSIRNVLQRDYAWIFYSEVLETFCYKRGPVSTPRLFYINSIRFKFRIKLYGNFIKYAKLIFQIFKQVHGFFKSISSITFDATRNNLFLFKKPRHSTHLWFSFTAKSGIFFKATRSNLNSNRLLNTFFRS